MSVVEEVRLAGPDYERGEFCHSAATPPCSVGVGLWESRTFCGKVLTEPPCCSEGFPDCGRESCPACEAVKSELGV
jgi:hypothetical protein